MKLAVFIGLFALLNVAHAAVTPMETTAPSVSGDEELVLENDGETIVFDEEDEDFLNKDEEILFAYVRYLQSQDLEARDEYLSVQDELVGELNEMPDELSVDPELEARLKASLEPKTPAPKKEAKASTDIPKTIKQ